MTIDRNSLETEVSVYLAEQTAGSGRASSKRLLPVSPGTGTQAMLYCFKENVEVFPVRGHDG
jgi:hypothetical protein